MLFNIIKYYQLHLRFILICKHFHGRLVIDYLLGIASIDGASVLTIGRSPLQRFTKYICIEIENMKFVLKFVSAARIIP